MNAKSKAVPISQAKKPNSVVPILWTIPEVCEHTRIPRTKIFEALKDGYLIAHKAGRINLIFDTDLADYISNLPISREGELRRSA